MDNLDSFSTQTDQVLNYGQQFSSSLDCTQQDNMGESSIQYPGQLKKRKFDATSSFSNHPLANTSANGSPANRNRLHSISSLRQVQPQVSSPTSKQDTIKNVASEERSGNSHSSVSEKILTFTHTVATFAETAGRSLLNTAISVKRFLDVPPEELEPESLKRRKVTHIPGAFPSYYPTNQRNVPELPSKPRAIIASSASKYPIQADLIYRRPASQKRIDQSLPKVSPNKIPRNSRIENGSQVTERRYSNQFVSNATTTLQPKASIPSYYRDSNFTSVEKQQRYEESLRVNQFLEGMRRHRLGIITRPLPSSASRTSPPRPPSALSPFLQRSPNSGSPLLTKVGGGSFFSRFQESQLRRASYSSPLGTPERSMIMSSSPFPPQFSHTSLPPSRQILASPGVMRAFKFDEKRLQRRRPIVQYGFSWYYKNPQIELPEESANADVYAQTYLRIIEKRQQMQEEIERLKRAEEENCARLQQKAQEEEAERQQKLLEEEKARAAATEVILPLDQDSLDQVKAVWSIRDPRRELVSAYRITITAHDTNTLRHGSWLNDNIIDYYLSMVTERSVNNSDSLPSSFAFSTHFYSKLQESGYGSVRRWAKRKGVDVTKMDYIFVPINRHNTHWCLAVINNRDLRFEFFDSMNGSGARAIEDLKSFMIQQTMELYPDSNPDELGYDRYELLDRLACPQQENAYDCGVFVCKMVEVLSRDKPLTVFSQKDMPNIRQRMVYEILQKRLLN